MERKQEIQDEQYKYPYHYIPSWGNNDFSQTHHWSWGYRYLGGVKVVLDQLRKHSFDSLVDIGCGDGRFLKEVAATYPNIRTLGIDYSERAIRLAQALNPELRYDVRNITDEPLDDVFDVAILIEVLEHIPPSDIDAFVAGVHGALCDRGTLILTVPHTNSSLAPKHYQHFNSVDLQDILGPYFGKIKTIPFDAHPGKMRLLERFPMSISRRLLGGEGSHFIVTNSWMNRFFFELYIKNYLYDIGEEKCARICVVAEAA
jgi:SAM-dependent methyltransferase